MRQQPTASSLSVTDQDMAGCLPPYAQWNQILFRFKTYSRKFCRRQYGLGSFFSFLGAFCFLTLSCFTFAPRAPLTLPGSLRLLQSAGDTSKFRPVSDGRLSDGRASEPILARQQPL